MTGASRGEVGQVFNEVPDLYDQVRPRYPDELFTDLTAITGLSPKSSVLEVGCGTGQATRSLAALGCAVTAIEPGSAMAALARQQLATFSNVVIEVSKFEDWTDRGGTFDLLVAASSWHWVDPSIGWRRAHDVLRPGGWMALLGHVVIRRPDEPEVYGETADLHEHFSPGNPGWAHPPTEEFASPCLTPSPSISGPRWATAHHADTSACFESGRPLRTSRSGDDETGPRRADRPGRTAGRAKPEHERRSQAR